MTTTIDPVESPLTETLESYFRIKTSCERSNTESALRISSKESRTTRPTPSWPGGPSTRAPGPSRCR